MTKNDRQVNVRLPDKLVERLRAAAESSERSLTAEIALRLQESFDDPLRDMMNLRFTEANRLRGEIDGVHFALKKAASSPRAGERKRLEGVLEQLKFALKLVGEDAIRLMNELYRLEPDVDFGPQHEQIRKKCQEYVDTLDVPP